MSEEQIAPKTYGQMVEENTALLTQIAELKRALLRTDELAKAAEIEAQTRTASKPKARQLDKNSASQFGRPYDGR
jgi:regulator of replication initiation timing